MQEPKSLDQWRHEIRVVGKRHWGTFYESFVGVPISNYPRFYRALNLYGEWAILEAVIASSNQTLTGDPLPYVLKVAQSKWKEDQLIKDEVDNYEDSIKEAIENSRKHNEELAKKLKKAKARRR